MFNPEDWINRGLLPVMNGNTSLLETRRGGTASRTRDNITAVPEADGGGCNYTQNRISPRVATRRDLNSEVLK